MANRRDGGGNSRRDFGKRHFRVQLDYPDSHPRAGVCHADDHYCTAEHRRQPHRAARIHTTIAAYPSAANYADDRPANYNGTANRTTALYYPSDRSGDHAGIDNTVDDHTEHGGFDSVSDRDDSTNNYRADILDGYLANNV